MTKRVLCVREKDCKHSVRYKAVKENDSIETIYLSRTYAPTMPSVIEVSITASSLTPDEAKGESNG